MKKIIILSFVCLNTICNSPQIIDGTQALKDLSSISSSLSSLTDLLTRCLAALKNCDDANKQNNNIFNSVANGISGLLPTIKQISDKANDVTKQLDDMQKRS